MCYLRIGIAVCVVIPAEQWWLCIDSWINYTQHHCGARRSTNSVNSSHCLRLVVASTIIAGFQKRLGKYHSDYCFCYSFLTEIKQLIPSFHWRFFFFFLLIFFWLNKFLILLCDNLNLLTTLLYVFCRFQKIFFRS